MLRDIHTEFETINIPITGRLVKVSAVLDEQIIAMKGGMLDTDKKYIRERLAMQIAGFLIDNNMIEFTQMKDPMDFRTHIMGRIFITPNDQTKLLRTLQR